MSAFWNASIRSGRMSHPSFFFLRIRSALGLKGKLSFLRRPVRFTALWLEGHYVKSRWGRNPNYSRPRPNNDLIPLIGWILIMHITCCIWSILQKLCQWSLILKKRDNKSLPRISSADVVSIWLNARHTVIESILGFTSISLTKGFLFIYLYLF